MKEPAKYTYTVVHPEYGTWRGPAEDAAGALLLAAEDWGERWTAIAAACTIRKGGRAEDPRCRRCGQKIRDGGGETKSPLCPDCRRAEEQWRREQARRRGPDRRKRYAYQ